MVKKIYSKSDLKEELDDAGNKLVVVDFTASWCPPCKLIAPEFENMAGEFADVVFLKADVDEANELALEYGIRCVPNFLFFKGKNKVHEMSGANPTKLREKIVELK